MKKILFSFLSVFLFFPLFAQPAVDIGARIKTQMQAQKAPLYAFVRAELQKYYGQESFADPQHTKGWYRVDDFLTWLNKNAHQLESAEINTAGTHIALKQIYTKPEAMQFKPLRLSFWVYLGARYIADAYQVKADFSRLKISYCERGSCSLGGTGVILLNPDQKDSVPAAVNLGIHEATHILPYLTRQGGEPLTELATFYSQYNYGLPVKKQDAATFGDTVRDVRLIYAARPDLALHYEYNYFVAGILLNPHIKPQDVLSFAKKRGVNGEVALWQAALHLLAAANNQFFVKPPKTSVSSFSMQQDSALFFTEGLGFSEENIKKWRAFPDKEFFLGMVAREKLPVFDSYMMPKKTPLFVTVHDDDFAFQAGFLGLNKNQYLEKMFGPYAKIKTLKTFYERLLKNLPPEVTDAAHQNWPAITPKTFQSPTAEREVRAKFANPYAKQFKEAVIRALAEANAPPPPPLPEGYL